MRHQRHDGAAQNEINVAGTRFHFGAACGDLRDNRIAVGEQHLVVVRQALHDLVELEPHDTGQRILR